MANTVGKFFPSEILSLATGDQTLGIAAGSVITAVSCFRVTGTVLPSLAIDNEKRFSLLPLVEFRYPGNGKTGKGQLYSLNYIIQGEPTYYEKYNFMPYFNFRVTSRYILYENYTAIKDSLKVVPLHIPLTSFNETLSSKDFSTIFYQFSENQNGLTDLHSILSVLSQTAVAKTEMNKAVHMLRPSSSKNDDADMSHVASVLQTFAHQTLFLALSEITSPIITVLIFTLQILAFIWASISSFKF